MSVTVHDVARAAGVSIATVSRALAGSERVAAATRDRVRATAAGLGYEPNRQAAALRAGRTGVLGLLVPDLANPYFAAIAQGVSSAARESDRDVFVVDSREDPTAEPGLVRRLARTTDGVVLASPRAPAAAREAAGATPLVVVNQDGPRAVVADFGDGVRQALAHLRSLGHRRIVYVGGPAASWSDARRRAALGPDVVALGAFAPSLEGGAAAAEAVRAAGASAIVTYNDVVAAGLVRALRERGADVPADVSVVSFDDTLAGLLGLTSVRTDLAGLGRAAVGLLAGDAARLVLPSALVVRDSTAPPPAARMGG